MPLRYNHAQLWSLLREQVAKCHPDLCNPDMILVVADVEDEGPTAVELLVAEDGEELDRLDLTFHDPYGKPVQRMKAAPATQLPAHRDCQAGPLSWPLVHGASQQEWERAHAEMMRNNKLWASLAFDGLQAGGNAGLLENRRCPNCGSTLSQPISLQEACERLRQQMELCARSAESLGASAPAPQSERVAA